MEQNPSCDADIQIAVLSLVTPPAVML